MSPTHACRFDPRPQLTQSHLGTLFSASPSRLLPSSFHARAATGAQPYHPKKAVLATAQEQQMTKRAPKGIPTRGAGIGKGKPLEESLNKSCLWLGKNRSSIKGGSWEMGCLNENVQSTVLNAAVSTACPAFHRCQDIGLYMAKLICVTGAGLVNIKGTSKKHKLYTFNGEMHIICAPAQRKTPQWAVHKHERINIYIDTHSLK